jgi:hypothetical protein
MGSFEDRVEFFEDRRKKKYKGRYKKRVPLRKIKGIQ